MAATTIGTSGLQFGLTSEGIGLVQSFSETRNIEKQEIRSNVGDVVGISYYNATTAYSLSVAVTGNYLVQAGSALAVLANAATLGTTRIDSITVNKSNDAFVTVDISATGYPNV
jgi:hypothetical protein